MKRPEGHPEQDAIDRIEELNAYIDHLEAQLPKWIDVKGRMPEEGQLVTVFYYKYNDPERAKIGTAELMPNQKVPKIWVVDSFFSWDIGTPTHWMPLPQPPQH